VRLAPSPPARVPRRALAARALALLAAACMVASAYGFRPQRASLVHYRPTPGPEDYYAGYAPWAFAAGTLLLLAALALSRVSEMPARRVAPRLAVLRPRWAWALTVPGLLALAAVTEANAALAGIEGLRALSHHAQAALLVGGMVLVALGLGGVGRLSLGGHHAREAALLLALSGAALGLRAVELGDAVRVMVDESHFVLGATYFRDFPDVKLLTPMPTSASFPFVFSYGQAGLVALIGRNLAGLRAFSAVLGALTVPALYLLGRALYGQVPSNQRDQLCLPVGEDERERSRGGHRCQQLDIGEDAEIGCTERKMPFVHHHAHHVAEAHQPQAERRPGQRQ